MPRITHLGTIGDDPINFALSHDPVDVFALAGNDQVHGSAFDDRIFADAGDDTVWGGEGHDRISGGAGNDVLYGGAGNDTIWDDSGNNSINGDDGRDLLIAGMGDDTINGGNGHDIIVAGGGFNLIWGGAGRDSITAGGRDDTISGDNGADTILGGAGHNLIWGGEGHDNINALNGNDTLTGDVGNDTIAAGNGLNVVWAGEGDDSVVSGRHNDSVSGAEGNDTVRAGDGADTVHAGDGHDIVQGGGGHDRITGDGGDDRLEGGGGNDVIFGGEGHDRILGGDGADSIFAEGGNDLVIHTLDLGGDSARGGAGHDTLRLDLTLDQWFDPAVQADIAAYYAYLLGGGQDAFFMASLGISAAEFERLGIVVNGTPLNPRDEAVHAADDEFSVGEDESATFNVLGNDTVPDLAKTVLISNVVVDPALDVLINLIVSGPHVGDLVVTVGANDWMAEGQTAQVTFTYTVFDADGDFDSADVTLTYVGANDGPVAGDIITDPALVEDDEADTVSGNLLANSYDPDQGDVIDIQSVGGETDGSVRGTYGTLFWNAEGGGDYFYVLDNEDEDTDALGDGDQVYDEFEFVVVDEHGATDTAWLRVLIHGRDDILPP